MSDTIYWNVESLNEFFNLPNIITHIELPAEEIELSKSEYCCFWKGKLRTEEERKAISDRRIGQKASLETKKKLSESKTGNKNFMYGRTHTEEARKKISEARKKLKGTYTHTEETKKKMSEAQRGQKHSMYGRKHSEESKRKMREAAEKRRLTSTDNIV